MVFPVLVQITLPPNSELPIHHFLKFLNVLDFCQFFQKITISCPGITVVEDTGYPSNTTPLPQVTASLVTFSHAQAMILNTSRAHILASAFEKLPVTSG